MCGRFALVTERYILELLFQIELKEEIAARYNIAPSEMLLALRRHPQTGEHEPVFLRWGLVPSWSRNKPRSGGLINIRSETAAAKFGAAFRQRRILIPASGFYEWKKEGKHKQPYFICRRDGSVIAFGGLYEGDSREEQSPPGNCAIITTAASSLIAPVHHRMPLIIPEELYSLWLDPGTPVEKLQKMLLPYPPERTSLYPVSRKVNSPAFDHPDCLRREQQ